MRTILFLLVATVISCGSGSDLLIQNTWVRLVPETTPHTAFYMTIQNRSDEPLVIVGAETSVARTVELHDTEIENEVMRMRKVEEIEISARGGRILEPGGLHIMLIDLVEPIQENDIIPMTLLFEDGKEIQIEGIVRAAEE